MGIIRTQKFLSAEQVKELHDEAVEASRIPVILLSQRYLGPNGKTEDQLAREAVSRSIDRACVAIGFDEPGKDEDGDVIHYGLDYKTGEVLLWDGQP